jgi:hypothetical protein
VLGPPGHDEVVARGEELPARVHHQATVVDRGEIDLSRQAIGIRHDLAVHPEAGDAAVGVDAEPQVRDAIWVLHREVLHSIAL